MALKIKQPELSSQDIERIIKWFRVAGICSSQEDVSLLEKITDKSIKDIY
jgi:hypothetical protein